MADTNKDIWNDADEEVTPRARKEKRGGSLKGKLALFFATFVIVLGIGVFLAYRDGTGFDALRRTLSYGSGKADGKVVYDYDADVGNHFAVLGDSLAVLSGRTLEILSRDGSTPWSASVNFASPALQRGGDRVVAYDIGGTELYVLGESGELLHLTQPDREQLIAASLNDKGWLTVVSGKQGYKGAVSVYNDAMEMVFDFKSSRRFLMDACLTADCSYLAAVTLGQEDGTFVSNVVLYDIHETEPKAQYDITDGIVTEIREQNGVLTAVTDTKLVCADRKGTVQGIYDYSNAYLRDFDLRGEDFTAVLLNDHQSGSSGRLLTLDEFGNVVGSLDVREEVLGISASGRYLAVLYTNRLVIYNRELQEYASQADTGLARDVLMRKDGSALLLSSEEASLFLP